MKAPDFAYVRAESLDQVFDLFAEHGDDARLLAGGQSLMATLNLRLSSPTLLIDLNKVPGLSGITETKTAVRIGAMTRHFEVETSPIVARHLPLIAAAMPHVAHAAIRNRGTLGGSIALADPAAEMPACVLALDAMIEATGPAGKRRIRSDDFFLGMFETALDPNEVLTAVEFQKSQNGWYWGFEELARRHGDYAMVGLAAMIKGEEICEKARLVFFGVEDRPVLARAAADALDGRRIDAEAIGAVKTALASDLDLHGDLQADPATKRHLANVLAERVLSALVAV